MPQPAPTSSPRGRGRKLETGERERGAADAERAPWAAGRRAPSRRGRSRSTTAAASLPSARASPSCEASAYCGRTSASGTTSVALDPSESERRRVRGARRREAASTDAAGGRPEEQEAREGRHGGVVARARRSASARSAGRQTVTDRLLGERSPRRPHGVGGSRRRTDRGGAPCGGGIGSHRHSRTGGRESVKRHPFVVHSPRVRPVCGRTGV
jgi:hypothetical protein